MLEIQSPIINRTLLPNHLKVLKEPSLDVTHVAHVARYHMSPIWYSSTYQCFFVCRSAMNAASEMRHDRTLRETVSSWSVWVLVWIAGTGCGSIHLISSSTSCFNTAWDSKFVAEIRDKIKEYLDFQGMITSHLGTGLRVQVQEDPLAVPHQWTHWESYPLCITRTLRSMIPSPTMNLIQWTHSPSIYLPLKYLAWLPYKRLHAQICEQCCKNSVFVQRQTCAFRNDLGSH